MSEQKTQMQMQFEKFERYLNALREVQETLQDILDQLAGDLTVARSAHSIAIIDTPFLQPLFEDITVERIVEVVNLCSPEVRDKFLMVTADLMKGGNDAA